jgi:hypothetical protein
LLLVHNATAHAAPTLADHHGHDMRFQFADYYLPDLVSVLKIMDKFACMRQASSCAVLQLARCFTIPRALSL